MEHPLAESTANFASCSQSQAGTQPRGGSSHATRARRKTSAHGATQLVAAQGLNPTAEPASTKSQLQKPHNSSHDHHTCTQNQHNQTPDVAPQQLHINHQQEKKPKQARRPKQFKNPTSVAQQPVVEAPSLETASMSQAADQSSVRIRSGQPARGKSRKPYKQHEQPPQEPAVLDDPVEEITCVICCEHVSAVAIGACDHNQICATCSLRMRMCFNDMRCPLCKLVQEEVVITPSHKSTPPPTFSELIAKKDMLWTKPKWARGVYFTLQRKKPNRAPLHVSLLQFTSIACSECDSQGRHPFSSIGLLQRHLGEMHQKQLCRVCLDAHSKFVLELPALTPQEMRTHMSTHARCEFCNRHFYGKDELYNHMMQQHFTCHVCQRHGAQHLYFADSAQLSHHIHSEHYVCDDPACEGCFIAFATEEELKQHCMRHHSASMPRWNPSRARPMVLDFGQVYQRSSRGGSRSGTPAGRGQSDGSGSGPGSGRGQEGRPARGTRSGQRGEASTEAGVQGVERPERAPVSRAVDLGDVWESEGGLAIIDDDTSLSSRPTADAGARSGPAGPAIVSQTPMLAGVWAARNPGAEHVDEFPSLQASLSAALPRIPGPAPQQPALAPLRKVTIRCNCGRRVMHLALRADEQPGALDCDRTCFAQRRKAQLADAFNVADPEHHASYFDRHRTPNYEPPLVAWAHENLALLRKVEQQIAVFLAEDGSKRCTLSVMPSAHRQMVHELVPSYGLASHSVGQEPQRAVQLFKTPTTGTPTRLLSEVAGSLSSQQVAALLAGQAPAHVLRLVDISPSANLHHYLREWAEQYTLTWLDASSATLTFHKEAAYLACSAALGGGVRNVFRVDRSNGAPAAKAVGGRASSSAGATWQQVDSKKRSGKQEAAAAPVADPWDSDDDGAKTAGRFGSGGVRGAASGGVHAGQAVDTWEAVAGGEDVGENVLKVPPIPLTERNMWQLLHDGDAQDEQGQQEDREEWDENA